MAKVERVCPECGSDRWVARDAERKREAAFRLNEQATKIARENGLLRLKLADAEARITEEASLRQRKISRQARVIRRLEDRLRELGAKPYEGAKIGETAPGADYDAGLANPEQPLPR